MKTLTDSDKAASAGMKVCGFCNTVRAAFGNPFMWQLAAFWKPFHDRTSSFWNSQPIGLA